MVAAWAFARFSALIILRTLIASAPPGDGAELKGSVDPETAAAAGPIQNDPAIGAKDLTGRKVLYRPKSPVRVVGFYAKGTIAGAEALPINGADTAGDGAIAQSATGRASSTWSALLERLSVKANKNAGWPGILVGDMSQPRGGR